MRFGARLWSYWLISLVAATTAAAEETSNPTGLTETNEAEVYGRGAVIGGDMRKFREDYDDLQSGGGSRARMAFRDNDGTYGALAGSFLFAERGDTLDGAEVALAAGAWDRLFLKGRFSLLQSYFDDSRETPIRSLPFSNDLGRTLHTNRADIDLDGELLVGDRGRLRLRYLHRENDGDRSTLKGSVTETFSGVAFRAPSFREVDVRVDEIELEAVLPLSAAQMALTGSYRNEANTMTTNDINFVDGPLRDRARYRDEAGSDVVHAGVRLATTSDMLIQGHAGYRFAYISADGASSQRVGPIAKVPARATDDVEVDATTHSGYAGVAFRPLDNLSVRLVNVIRHDDRRGRGSESRLESNGAASGLLRNRTDKDTFRSSPRASLSYSGLPRTRLRAHYRFDYLDRDLELRSLTDGGGSAVDGIQRTNLEVYRNDLRISAETRLARRVRAELGYQLLRELLDETVEELVNQSTLGDRRRESDRIYAKVRFRTAGRTSVQLAGEYARRRHDRTDIRGNSSTEMEGCRIDAQVLTQQFAGLSTQAIFSYVDRDYEVGEEAERNLRVFRDIEFHDRSTVGSLLASWNPTPALSLRGRYSAAAASASLDDISQRAHFDAGYRAGETFRLGAGYSFLGFDEDRFSGDDFDAHFAWLRGEYSF